MRDSLYSISLIGLLASLVVLIAFGYLVIRHITKKQIERLMKDESSKKELQDHEMTI